MPNRDVVSWNSMILGYLKMGEIDLAHELLDRMPERDIFSCNAMIDAYGKCGMASDVQPDAPAIVNVLSAVADLGFVEEGKWLHNYVTANGISLSLGFIGSSLIDMYSKYRYIEHAKAVFKSISYRRNVGDWNSMISGLAIHGLGQEAISVFLQMESMGIKPDEVTFVGLLAACAYSGLVDEGKLYFGIMPQKYNATEGYEPDLSQVLLDAEEGGKEVSLSLHSEKLAIAFALLNNTRGAPIHVMKNLRICCDFHYFIKLVSKVNVSVIKPPAVKMCAFTRYPAVCFTLHWTCLTKPQEQ
ncbi:hypothetical protein Cgig2_028685 [Carnegiea gigantea]|uniref:DYW domain-containing protein n=1 Tax=Carnegiea gigantea TaxID=171969 RepID=A0A9Q1KCX4_9CARY|nr:hypothetical protein Cgig2_028685 [Carnegiea gigantea]